jgi:hypothetical protein
MSITFSSLHVAFLLFGLFTQQPPTPAQKQAAGTGVMNLTAASANVSDPGNAVRINIFRWSSEQERNPILTALNPPKPTTPAATAAAGERGGRGGGAGRGGRGGGDRGAGGRGGRGDDAAAAPAVVDPIAALTAAIGKAPTVGYIWTNEVTGYSIKYAYRASLPEGGERIILATDRRLGGYSAAWKPVSSAPLTNFEFTIIEIRLDPKGLGEGKTSLTTKVIADNEAKTLALENYATTPAILQKVKR